MKAILALLLLFVTITAGAKERFELKFLDESTIVNDDNDWYFVGEEKSIYKLYVSKDSIRTKQPQVPVHTRVEYDGENGYKFNALPKPIKRIFSGGIVDCDNAMFYLMADFFVDSSNSIVHFQPHELGEYRVEMQTPNTARNGLYKAVCELE